MPPSSSLGLGSGAGCATCRRTGARSWRAHGSASRWCGSAYSSPPASRAMASCRRARCAFTKAASLRSNSLFVEHNGLLADSAHAPAVWRAVLGLLTRRGAWHQVRLAGLSPPTVELCLEAARAYGREVVVHQRRPSAYLDLAALRASGRNLAHALSRNTRHQLARARRLYEAIGPLTLRAAESAEEALAMLDRLKALHQTSWQRRGQPGCFAAPWFESFHRDLIRARFSSGEIQLLAATAGDRPIGYLYNFAHRDRVYAYQSGIRLRGRRTPEARARDPRARDRASHARRLCHIRFHGRRESAEGQLCFPLDRDGLARRAETRWAISGVELAAQLRTPEWRSGRVPSCHRVALIARPDAWAGGRPRRG